MVKFGHCSYMGKRFISISSFASFAGDTRVPLIVSNQGVQFWMVDKRTVNILSNLAWGKCVAKQELSFGHVTAINFRDLQ